MKSRRNKTSQPNRSGSKQRFGKIMNCICSAEQLQAADDIRPSSESLATRDYLVSAGHFSRPGDVNKQPQDTRNIEEAESTLRESGSLNYEEARALLGRIEYQKGNIEGALHVFEGIDIAAATSKMKATLTSRRVESQRKRSHNYASPPMSIHAVSLLFEAIFLKAKSLQGLRRYKEAAQSCKVILDILESSLPDGLPENLGADCKLQETLTKAVELLPELWKLADCPREAILSYRRALLHYWNLDMETLARIQKEFAVFLLYCGGEASPPPNLRSQMDGAFVPRNNIEEAILLLMILLKKIYLKRIEWDPSILNHLSFALSVSGDMRPLATRIEELLPGIISRKERYYLLALCYQGAGEDLVALNLLRKLLSTAEYPNCIPALLMASQICGEKPDLAEEGISYAHRARDCLDGGCDQLGCTANFLLGVSLATQSKLDIVESERSTRQSQALKALESAAISTTIKEPKILYRLSLEYAEQRKLDAALYYGKSLLKLEDGSHVKGWLLIARILSAQKRFGDAETIISAGLEQTGKWDQGELLRTKAKLQIAQGQLKRAMETYTQLLAVFQVQSKSFVSGRKFHKDSANLPRNLELDVWHDLAYLFIKLSQWHDAEVCLSKSKAIVAYSATRCHAYGVIYEKKGIDKEALQAFVSALDIDPNHVPSLMSIALLLKRRGGKFAVVRSLFVAARQLDRMNASAWYNLGLLLLSEGTESAKLEAAECLEAAYLLEETAPIEPFR